jgi:hypothetical protein
VDVRYDPENQNWKNRRINDELIFAGDAYNIVDIKSDEIVLLSKSTSRVFDIRFTGTLSNPASSTPATAPVSTNAVPNNKAP